MLQDIQSVPPSLGEGRDQIPHFITPPISFNVFERFISTQPGRPCPPRWQRPAAGPRPACRSGAICQFFDPFLRNDVKNGRYDTNLPLGELQVHPVTAFSLQTRAFLEGSADRAGSDGQVAVVAVTPVSNCMGHGRRCRINAIATHTSNRQLSKWLSS